MKIREVREWKIRMDNKPKLRLYRILKLDLGREDYLEMDLTFNQRKAITIMRSGTHKLRVETGRWNKEESKEEHARFFCQSGLIETKEHFLLDCYVLERIRDGLRTNIKTDIGVDIRR